MPLLTHQHASIVGTKVFGKLRSHFGEGKVEVELWGQFVITARPSPPGTRGDILGFVTPAEVRHGL